MGVILDNAKLERARSLCNQACYTVALQVRRLRSKEPEDDKFLFRWWADLQFLIVALRRAERAASIAKSVPEVGAAILEFRRALPHLATWRNVGEHVDDYATDAPTRREKTVDGASLIDRRSLQVGGFDGTVYEWLGRELNIDDALRAVERLFIAVRDASNAGNNLDTQERNT